MSIKNYINNIIKNNNIQGRKLKEEAEKREKAYTVGTAATAIIGAVTTFMNPFFGIPMLSLAGAFYLGKERNKKIKEASLSRYIGENRHLNNILKNGVNSKRELNEKRKAEITKLDNIRKEQNNEWNRSLSRSNFANFLVCCSAAAAMYFGGPILTALSVGNLLYKNYADKKYVEAQKNICNTCMKMNNIIYDYNISNTINNEQIKNNNPVKAKQTTNAKTKAKQVQNNSVGINMNDYSDADIKAVDEYLRQLDGVEQKENQKQKRKI